MKRLLIKALAIAVSVAAAPVAAEARFFDPGIAQSTIVEPVQRCRRVRERIVRPNGSIVYRTVRRCRPSWRRPREVCRLRRERVVRPSGAVVYRTVRICR